MNLSTVRTQSYVEFQADDLARSREELALKNSEYRDLSSVSAKKLLTICELQRAKQSLEVELGRLEAEAVIGAQEHKDEIQQYERQLEQTNAQNAALGENIHIIIRLGASNRNKSRAGPKRLGHREVG